MSPAARQTLTELECCVLAVVWRQGPCSAYSVRAEFARSLSSHWSASAGSIYPLVSRLCRRGLIDAVAASGDSRGRRDLVVSPAGEAAVRGWVAGIEPSTAAPSYDPVRTRVLFLDALAAKARPAFLRRAIEETEARLQEVRQYLASLADENNRHEELGVLGAVYELEGRLAWLREVSRRCAAEWAEE